MANSFNIPEGTLSQLGDSTSAFNTTTRKSVYQPLVVRAVDHDFDNGVNADTEEKLTAGAALFYQKAHGHPWILGKSDVATESIVFETKADPLAVPTNATVIYPNFDYSTFE
jgi:hypothetical protein